MTMNTGDIGRRLGFTISTEAIIAAGVTVSGTDKRATLFGDPWPVICDKVSAYVLSRKSAPAVAKPAPAPKPVKAAKVAEADPRQQSIAEAASKTSSDDDWENDDDDL